MNFELAPLWTYLAVAVYAVSAITALLLVAGAVDFVVRNHRTRIARQESIPSYYRHLLAH